MLHNWKTSLLQLFPTFVSMFAIFLATFNPTSNQLENTPVWVKWQPTRRIYCIPRTQLTYISKDLTHKMEAQPPKTRSQMGSSM